MTKQDHAAYGRMNTTTKGKTMTTTNPMYPDVEVEISEQDGNAMMIIARVSRAIKRAHGTEAAQAYRERAMSGDYDNVIQESMSTVVVS